MFFGFIQDFEKFCADLFSRTDDFACFCKINFREKGKNSRNITKFNLTKINPIKVAVFSISLFVKFENTISPDSLKPFSFFIVQKLFLI